MVVMIAKPLVPLAAFTSQGKFVVLPVCNSQDHEENIMYCAHRLSHQRGDLQFEHKMVLVVSITVSQISQPFTIGKGFASIVLCSMCHLWLQMSEFMACTCTLIEFSLSGMQTCSACTGRIFFTWAQCLVSSLCFWTIHCLMSFVKNSIMSHSSVLPQDSQCHNVEQYHLLHKIMSLHAMHLLKLSHKFEESIHCYLKEQGTMRIC